MLRRRPAKPSGFESAPPAGEYRSALFGRFVRRLGRLGREVEVLDLGTGTAANALYWAERGHRTARVDVLSGAGLDAVLRKLTGRRFGGIMCWNVLSHLAAPEASSLAHELVETLLPGGVLFAVFEGDGREAAPAFRYRIVDDARLQFERDDRAGSVRAVSTKEIEALLAGLAPLRVTVMRHGSREVLGVRAS